MQTRFFRLIFVFLLAAASFSSVQAKPWQAKVSAQVLDALSQGEADFLVVLAEQADLDAAAALPTKQAKGEAVYRTLTELAARTQAPLIAELRRQGAEYRAYWVANLIWAHGDAQLAQTLAARSDVAFLAANPSQQLDLLPQPPQPLAPQIPAAIEWNIAKVNADDVWAAGFTGQGVVVAGQDTGYIWDHPALKNHYRGWNGTAASHDYNWHDATAGGSPNTPVDPHGHGTHTMGTMVGDDGAGNQIGMAPGARWIGCRNMNSSGYGTPQTYTECFQWFLAPTKLDGSSPRIDLAPDVINNSWGCPASEGCDAAAIQAMQLVVESVRAAGIMVVASAGNAGSSCGSVNDPPAVYDATFTVGNTTASDTINGSSSRGPADYTGQAKPDVSAPGTSIRSAYPGSSYSFLSGTSMASPHVAGEVALLISAFPLLRGDVDALETLITRSALPRVDTTCGGSVGGIPNNVYGWGRIDAWAAYQLAQGHRLGVSKQAPSTVALEQPITYTLTVTYTGLLPTHGVVLTDVLPLHTSLITATLPFTQTGDTIAWGLGDFSNGDSRVVHLVVLPGGTAKQVINQAYGARSTDVARSAAGLPVSTQVLDRLSLSKQAPAWVSGDAPITYTLTITNARLAFTSPLVLSDTLPAYTTFVTATLPYTLTGQVIEWPVGALAPDEVRQLTLAVQPDAHQTKQIVNEHYGLHNSEVTQTLSGPPVVTRIWDRLSLSKQAPDWADGDTPITYTLIITNARPLSTAPLVLSDTLPAYTTFVAASRPYTLTGNVIEWPVGILASGEVRQVTLAVQPNASQTKQIVNDQYGVRSQEVTQTLSGPPVVTYILDDLSLSKLAPAQVRMGERITYTLVITNNRSQPSLPLVLTDTLPANTTFLAATLPYTRTGNFITWNFASLAPGQVQRVTLVVQAPITFTGVITNSRYGLRTLDFSLQVGGPSVTTRVWWATFIPLLIKP
jgi:uncharacterized repeat protein (TIGR01451 family)